MEPLKFRWQKMIASIHGPESPTTRHVLLTLSLFMDNDGGSCFPATRTIADNTGLSERSVCTHLELAANTGWIKKTERAGNGQAWKRHSYEAAIPEKALKEVQHVEKKGTERGSARQAKGTEPLSKGTEPDDKKALKEVQSNTHITLNEQSYNNADSFILKDGSFFHVDRDFKSILEDTYPTVEIITELKKLSAWCYANESKRKTRKGAKRFVNSWMANAAKDSSRPTNSRVTAPEGKYAGL